MAALVENLSAQLRESLLSPVNLVRDPVTLAVIPDSLPPTPPGPFATEASVPQPTGTAVYFTFSSSPRAVVYQNVWRFEGQPGGYARNGNTVWFVSAVTGQPVAP